MRSAVFPALLFSVIAPAAMAQNATPAAPAAPAAIAPGVEQKEVTADAPKVKTICVRRPAETGSHFGGGKECHTETEWTMQHNMSLSTLERLRALQNADELRAIQAGSK